MKKTTGKSAKKKSAAPRGSLKGSTPKDRAAAKSGVSGSRAAGKSPAGGSTGGTSVEREFPEAVYQDQRRS